jgi:hypothetical protein
MMSAFAAPANASTKAAIAKILRPLKSLAAALVTAGWLGLLLLTKTRIALNSYR